VSKKCKGRAGVKKKKREVLQVMDVAGKKEAKKEKGNKHGALQRLSSYGLFFTLPPFSLLSKMRGLPSFNRFPFSAFFLLKFLLRSRSSCRSQPRFGTSMHLA
jgi:hypothetical protein